MPISSILLCTLACFFWGLIFVTPLYLSQFDCIDIVLGRYLVFGTFSCAMLFYYFYRDNTLAFLKFWKEAVLCALIMNFGYYTALTLGIRFSEPSVIALIVGSAPLMIGALDCKRLKLPFFQFLFYPTFLTFLGIFLTNIEPFLEHSHLLLPLIPYSFGIFCGFIALAAWTWFVIYNTRFLQVNPSVSAGQWTTLIGFVTFFMAILGIGLRFAYAPTAYLAQFSFHHHGIIFLQGTAVLGLICSALAFTLWNKACINLPPLLSGQLAILETVFGLLFIYAIQFRLPSFIEFTGIMFILGGVWSSIYLFHQYSNKKNVLEEISS